MALPRRSTTALLRLSFSQTRLSFLFLCKRSGLRAVLLVLRPALSGELCGLSREQCLPEPLNAQLSDKSQTCGSEQHLLAHWRGIGDVSHGSEAVWLAGSEFEEDIAGGGGREVGSEL
jgi:hypothetical protein